jgi:hypothetical protein
MTAKQIRECFLKHDDEYLEFDRIHPDNRIHPARDICAMLYLYARDGKSGEVIGAAARDWIAFGFNVDGCELTEADVVYLLRCGVRYDGETDRLMMFV